MSGYYAPQIPASNPSSGGGGSSGGGFNPFGFLGSIGSSLIGNSGAKRRQKRADKVNLENWHRQNKYNHPLEQMQRLKEAGLNPNMIYGNSPGSAVGNAGSAVHASKAAPYSFENPVLPGFQTGQIQAQTQNTAANTLNTLELRGLNKVNREKAEATKADLIELTHTELKTQKENYKTAQYTALKASKSWMNEVDTIKQRLDIAKSENKIKAYNIEEAKLDAAFAREYNLRKTDWLIYRKAMEFKEWLQGSDYIPAKDSTEFIQRGRENTRMHQDMLSRGYIWNAQKNKYVLK